MTEITDLDEQFTDFNGHYGQFTTEESIEWSVTKKISKAIKRKGRAGRSRIGQASSKRADVKLRKFD